MSGNTLVAPFTMTRLQAVLALAAIRNEICFHRRELMRFAPGYASRKDATLFIDLLTDLYDSMQHLLDGNADSTLAALSAPAELALEADHV